MVTVIEGTPPNHFTICDDPYDSCFNCKGFQIREFQGGVRYIEQMCVTHKLKFSHRRNYLEYEKIKCADHRPQARD